MSDNDDFPLRMGQLLGALEATRFALAVSRADGRLVWVNAAMGLLTGYSATELTDLEHWDVLVHPANRQDVRDLNQGRVRGDGVPDTYDTVFVRRDGSAISVEVAVQRFGSGDAARVLAIIRDVTERHAAQTQAQRMASILDATSDAIVSASIDGTITSWNQGAEAMFGYTAAEVVGRSGAFLVPDEDLGDVPNLRATVLQGDVLRNFETRRRRRDGSDVAVAFSAARLLDPSGEITGVSAIYRDISDRVRADQERHDREAADLARLQAVEASRLKSEFLSRMSHELRTPLNAILGFSQLLGMDALDSAQRAAVGHIEHAGRHLLELIDEVLDITRLETGALRLSLESVELGLVCDEAVAMVRPIAESRSVTLVLDAASVDVRVRADQQRLKQVLLNLLANGVKYNRADGTVTVSAQPVDGGRVRITVADSGIGIAADKLDRLFQPFERLAEDHEGVEGVGLGLALSRDLVVAMGGDIGVSSRSGVGSDFWFEIPLAAEPAASAVAPVARADHPVAASIGSATVLYVEDNLANVRLLEHIVARRPDITLLVAMQGRAAIDLANAYVPDLVLLDLHLPDMAGEEVLRQLKAGPVTAGVPVVVVTADATSGVARRVKELGAVGFVTKPFEIVRMLALLDAAAGHRAGRDPDSAYRDPPAAESSIAPDPIADARERAMVLVHDLKNHLGAIRNYCSLVEGQVPEQAALDIQVIHQATDLAIDAIVRLDGVLQDLTKEAGE